MPIALDHCAIQMAISIARHDAIGLHYQGLAVRDGRIVRWRFLRGLDMRPSGALFAFEFGTGGFRMGPQRLNAVSFSRALVCAEIRAKCQNRNKTGLVVIRVRAPPRVSAHSLRSMCEMHATLPHYVGGVARGGKDYEAQRRARAHHTYW